MRRLWLLAVLVALAGVAPAVLPDARADEPHSSLPTVASGERPGPDVLYAPPVDSALLANHDPRFRAAPLLVMGEEAYVDGEYQYQDWLYDDTGGGDGVYPPGDDHVGNAADLVELRIAPGPDDVAYRFTLNTLLSEDTTRIALGVDADGDTTTGETHDAGGVAMPGVEAVLVLVGGQASWDGEPVELVTDLEANQLTAIVPRALADPGAETWHVMLAVGVEGAPEPDPLTGSASTVMDLGFQMDEEPAGLTGHDARQSEVIAGGDASPYRHPLDFSKMVAGVLETTAPATGTMGRIFPSRHPEYQEGGKDLDASPQLRSQLQMYSIYVPTTYDAAVPAPLMLDLHSLGERHWQYNGSVGVQQIGEERGAIVISCDCRGEDGWYQHEAEYDVFEMWNDVARRYTLDPDRVGITGYSMGGYATYRLATLYPDLFGKALSIVGPPTGGIWFPPVAGHDETLTNIWLENARNVPFMNVVGMADELVPYYGTRAQNLGAPEQGIRGFDQLGYRFRFMSYPTADHFALAVLGYDLPYQAEWLGDTFVDRDPDHVTFRYVPAADDPALGLVHDKAYWISSIRLASADGELPSALVDARSHASGAGDPPTVAGQDAGNGPMPYVEVNRSWGEPPEIPAENTLTLRLTNVGEVTIDLARAGLTLDGLELDVRADTDAIVHLVDGDEVLDIAVRSEQVEESLGP